MKLLNSWMIHKKEDPVLDVYLNGDEGYSSVGDVEEDDDDLDPPQRQGERVSPNMCGDVPSVTTTRRPPRNRRASCDHDDILKQLLHNMEMLNKKVDTIMNWMRPSQNPHGDHSFGVHGVSETEHDNNEEVGRETHIENILGETRAGNVGEFERDIEMGVETIIGDAVMETVVRDIDRGVETQDEGETAVGVKERETGIGGTTRMYTKTFTRKKRNLDQSDQQTDVLMQDKRIKKASKLVSSPYTTGAKWRRHVDNTKVDRFRDVDPVKKKHFLKWHSSLCDGASYKLGHINLKDAKIWFNDVLKPGGWFLDEHVDMALHLLRARARKYPKSFGGSRAILDVQFNNELIFAMFDLLDQGDHFRIPVELMKYVNGANPSFGRKWQDCTHVYFPLCTRKHWLAVEIDFSKATIFVYDPDKSCITNDQLKDDLKAASIIFPLLLKEINIDLGTCTLDIQRSVKTTKQAISGDCGMYVIKYIEFLSINCPVEQVNSFYMNRWREKMAADIFALDYEP